MKVEIERKVENPLLERTEIHFTVDHEGGPTPKREEVKAQLASILNVEKDTVIIDSIKTEFGKQVSRGYAKVYRSVEIAKKIENEYQLVRNDLKEKE